MIYDFSNSKFKLDKLENTWQRFTVEGDKLIIPKDGFAAVLVNSIVVGTIAFLEIRENSIYCNLNDKKYTSLNEVEEYIFSIFEEYIFSIPEIQSNLTCYLVEDDNPFENQEDDIEFFKQGVDYHYALTPEEMYKENLNTFISSGKYILKYYLHKLKLIKL